MKSIPSDFKLLSEIYQRYYDQFIKFNPKAPDRTTKTYISIDIEAIADHFKVDEEIIFGRLYLHLEKKYGFKNNDGSISPFFAKNIGKDRHAINFPLLASVLAGLQEERNKQNIAMYLSIAAIIISVFSLVNNTFKTWSEIKDGRTEYTYHEEVNQPVCKQIQQSKSQRNNR